MTGRRGEAALDKWSFVHLASGLALGAIGAGFALGFGLLVAYEVVEALLRKGRSGPGVFEYESWWNIVADLCFGMGGFVLAYAVRVWLDLGPFSI